MLDWNEYPLLAGLQASLKETSADNRDKKKPTVYMTESLQPVIPFDTVKNKYIRRLHLSNTPESCDALFQNGDTLFLIEFKNGHIDQKVQYEIRKKIYDSLLIFTDITALGISELRSRMEYILVYNEAANRNVKGPVLQTENPPPVSSYNELAKNLSGYAGTEYICFGLQIFQNYCFKAVHTYTQAEFENYLSKLPHV